jgi:hypothetical protein
MIDLSILDGARDDEMKAAFALYRDEHKDADEIVVSLIWNSEPEVQARMLQKVRVVMKSTQESIAESEMKLPSDQRACIDILAVCAKYSILDIQMALAVAIVDRIADAHGREPNETALAYYTYLDMVLDSCAHELEVMREEQARAIPVGVMDVVVREFTA